MLDQLRRSIARLLVRGMHSPRAGVRSYAGARNSRMTVGFGSTGNSSADAELAGSLTQLRARSRQLMRDAPYAKRAKTIFVNNVVGAGVGLQAQVKNSRKELHDGINDAIETAFRRWSLADNCHTGGALHFADLERLAMSEVVTAGEVLIRMHPRAFGQSTVPLALEVIEAERLADEFATTQLVSTGADLRMGVEQDAFGRPLAYWIRDRHPGELRVTPERAARITRVPADQILHLRLIDRWPQSRGEPWLHAVLRKLNDMNEYSGAELMAARGSANYFATITSPESDNPLSATTEADGSRQLEIEPLTIEQLSPGDELTFHAPNRPNTALDPFLRYMLREYSAGTNISYESISQDYSQSNYSSSRLARLDERDMWRVLQAWWVRSFRAQLHGVWLRQAVLSRAVAEIPLEAYALQPERFERVRWKLRGWSWVDPTREITAFKDAVRAGFTTVSAVIAQTAGGLDIEDVIAERKEELEMLAEAGIEVDTTVRQNVPAEAAAGAQTQHPPDNQDDGGKPARVVSIAR